MNEPQLITPSVGQLQQLRHVFQKTGTEGNRDVQELLNEFQRLHLFPILTELETLKAVPQVRWRLYSDKIKVEEGLFSHIVGSIDAWAVSPFQAATHYLSYDDLKAIPVMPPPTEREIAVEEFEAWWSSYVGKGSVSSDARNAWLAAKGF